MKFELDKHEKYTLFILKNEKLISDIAPKLKSEFVQMNATGVKNIILDLSNVKYVDSSGLSSMLVANRLCKSIDGIFIITGLNEQVKKLIYISQLEKTLTIVPTQEESIDLVFMHEIEKELLKQ